MRNSIQIRLVHTLVYLNHETGFVILITLVKKGILYGEPNGQVLRQVYNCSIKVAHTI